jgi:hypothetical protein
VTTSVFINYRGDGSRSYAALLYRELRQLFGDETAFLDSESIPAGADFEPYLLAKLRECRAMLAVVGPRWLMLADQAGRRRIDDPADWIRRGLVEAFRAGIKVIPIVTDDATLPAPDDLPTDIATLGRCQYRKLRHKDASADLARVVADVAAITRLSSLARSNGDADRWRRYPVGIDHEWLLGADATIASITDLVAVRPPVGRSPCRGRVVGGRPR